MVQHKAKMTNHFDWNSFVQQPDPKVQSNLASSTRTNVEFVRRNFQRYSWYRHPEVQSPP